jgi:hypothetical protein
MKYSKKTLAVLVSDVRALVDQSFRFELSQSEIIENFNTFLAVNMKTDSGKNRYPDYYSIALTAFFNEFINLRADESLIWCYLVDGKLYHGMKKCLLSSRYKGDTISFPNYRDLPEIEDKILNGNCIERGFYYNSGKKYY